MVCLELDRTPGYTPACAVTAVTECQHRAVAVCWECDPPLLSCFSCAVAHADRGEL